jgi:hypothetical protein
MKSLSLNKTIKRSSSKRTSNSTYKNMKKTKSNHDKWYAVNYLSIIIFQSFEDFLTAHDLDETGDYVWICNYVQWVSSPKLQEKWDVLKSNFGNTTIAFGDILFNSVKNKKINNYNDIKEIANEIINSKEYKAIIDIKSNK